MAYFTTTDGTNIFYKDWGPRDAQPIVFALPFAGVMLLAIA